MMSGVLTDEINDWHVRPARVVQIGESVPETGTEMKQSACRFLSHAGVAVRGSGHNSFEQAQHASHFSDSIKSSNDMDFRRARVCKAGVYPSGQQRAN